MKNFLSILAFLAISLSSISQTCLITNQTGFDWDCDIFIAPLGPVALPASCAPYYPPLTPSITRVDIGATAYHATITIPGQQITPCTPAPPIPYCAFWQGYATSIGMPPIPPGHTVVRAILTKAANVTIPPSGCMAPLTVMVEIDEFTNTNTCRPRELKTITCGSQPDGNFYFQLDHVINMCTYCADYSPSGENSGINIGNW